MPDFFLDESELPKRIRYKPARPKSGCSGCGLRDGCVTPKMQPYGGGRLRIAVVGEAPGEEEDQKGRPFVGLSGQFLRRNLAEAGLDLDEDCVASNVVLCRPTDAKGENRTPTDGEVLACRRYLDAWLESLQPELIVALGGKAIAAVLSDAPFVPSATQMHGRIVPCHARGCWVACGFHPSYYLHEKGKHDARMAEFCELVVDRVASGLDLEDRRLDPSAYEIVEDPREVLRRLSGLVEAGRPVAFDYETTGLDPWADKARILCCAFASSPESGWCLPLDHPQAGWSGGELADVKQMLASWLAGPCPKVIQNWQFEEVWSRVHFSVGIANVVADTMLKEHVLDNRAGVCGQAFMEYVRFGECSHKGMVNVARLKDEFLDTVARYNVLDVRYDIAIHRMQEEEMPHEF